MRSRLPQPSPFAMKFLPVLTLSLCLFAPSAWSRPSDPGADDLSARLRRLSPFQMDEVLWLARCVYSESDRPHEQRLVAWVVRNRVETRYRGDTYREVVLETKQFSAFNTPSPRREHILGLQLDTKLPAWRETLRIALDVYLADAGERPFPVTTRHFYSPVSMVGRAEPTWAEGVTALSSQALGVDPNRFQFFTDVDPELAGTPASIVDAAPSGGGGQAGSGTVVRTRTSLKLPPPRMSGRINRPARPNVRRPGKL